MRRMLVGVVLLAALHSSPSYCQQPERYKSCLEAATAQAAMRVCADEEAKRADAELRDTYQKLLVIAERQPGAIAKVRATQKAWLAYRDAYIDAMYPAKNKLAAYGSIFPMEVALLRANLTHLHIAALMDLLKQYNLR